MNLEQFIAQTHPAIRGWAPRREHVTCRGFEEMYVRRTSRYYENIFYLDVLDLATIAAKKPGKGSFKKLISGLTTKYLGLSLYVESVFSPQFQDGLLRLGFKPYEEMVFSQSQNYFLPASQPVGVNIMKGGLYAAISAPREQP